MLRHLRHNIRHTLTALLVGGLFYVAQAAAQLHSIDHVFHDAQESCVQFLSIENHKPGIVHNALLINGGNQFELSVKPMQSQHQPRLIGKQHCRAPPLPYPA